MCARSGSRCFSCARSHVAQQRVHAVRKARTVEHFHRSSYAIGLTLLQQAGTTLADKHGLDPAEYAAHGGSFLKVANVGVIGAVAVSGLPQRDTIIN